MKKVVIILALLNSFNLAQAQDEENRRDDEKKGGFKKENIFTGGGAIVSVGSYSTLLGASPVLGYSITNWLDAGISFNYNYASSRYVYYDYNTGRYIVSGDKDRQHVIGSGVFVRAYPLKFLFINVQAEHNFTTDKRIRTNLPTTKDRYEANSLLLGVGYASGREGVGDFYYYISAMIDVAGNANSPYVAISESTGKAVIIPIFKAGIQIPLFQGKRNRD